MRLAYITHPSSLRHDMGPGHPECPERVSAINEGLRAAGLLDLLEAVEAKPASQEQILRAHDAQHYANLQARSPGQGLVAIDPDTAMNPHTWQAALHAAGAVVQAAELVTGAGFGRAFCNLRPPGHHAERGRAMGFCFFNNVAIGMLHALEALGLQRVALVDFDVHHGNGSEDILAGDDRVLMVSSFQSPLYPYSGETPLGANMRNIALPPYSTGKALRQAVLEQWLPALRKFGPQLVFISAGFDAHQDDPLSQLGWTDEDYGWVTRQIIQLADECAQGRVISTLEGGYHLQALARCAALHVRALLGID
ncbi:MAG: histone deacetylase family protein [Quisquiliibacterium sp.]